ncbi:MAG TPA: hypothetical protein VK745_08130 [Polyangiaceae bacterium]|nr:hypothetical protein [Polyangiaceae bacterium]
MLLLAAAGLLIGVFGYRMYHRGDHTLPDLAALPVPPVLSTNVVPSAVSPVIADTAAAHEPAASATAADFQTAPVPAPTQPNPAAAVPAAPAASGAPTAAETAENAPAPGAQRITITTVPPKAKFFHFGKEVGTSPFVVDLPPGEKRAYEVWLPGHITRKVLVDGSKTDISIGLRESP